jgi:hypothetical protein
MKEFCKYWGVLHEHWIPGLETSLHYRGDQLKWALRSLPYLEKLTDTMKISIARLRDFADPEIRQFALELSERFVGVSEFCRLISKNHSTRFSESAMGRIPISQELMPFPFGGEFAVASLAGALHFYGEGVVVIGSVEVHANEF